MSLTAYIYLEGEETDERTFLGGTRISVHGKFSQLLFPIPGAQVTTTVLGARATCFTDIAGWYKCTLTLPEVSASTSIKVHAYSPVQTETKFVSITILGNGNGNGPPPENTRARNWLFAIGGAALLGVVVAVLTKEK